MQKHILQLARLARQRSRRIIGLMSGTSLDGLDVALCRFEGAGHRTRFEVEAFETVPYEEAFKSEVRQVFAKRNIDFQHLTLLNVKVAEQQAAMVNTCLRKWGILPTEVDLVASHGQTVFHAPRVFHSLPDQPNATLQIGDGDHLARRTGIITISDFRQKHCAAGGEGAPLALYGDYFLFSKKGEDRFLLNLGGIANFTFLPGNGDSALALATDTGPGNTLLDTFASLLFGVPFDEDARLARNGQVDERLLDALRKEPFFAKPFPKTIGPELFSAEWVRQTLQHLPKGGPNPYDLMATLTRLTADTVAEALLRIPRTVRKRPHLYLSGGGAHNPLVWQFLQENLPRWDVSFMSDLGVDGDAKEALLFAVLANETVAGRTTEGAVLSGLPVVGMGKVSFPA